MEDHSVHIDMIMLRIEGMSCSVNCAPKVEKALCTVEGVESVEVSFPDKTAKITLQPHAVVDESRLIQAVESAGSKFRAALLDSRQKTSERTVVLMVEGMACAKNCAPKVRIALLSVAGVTNATVDFPSKSASITLKADSTATEVDLVKAIRSISPHYNAYVAGSEGIKENARIITLNIEGMKCAAKCAKKVQDVLTNTVGVADAKVDFIQKSAVVTVNPASRVTEHDLVKSIESLGSRFKASVKNQIDGVELSTVKQSPLKKTKPDEVSISVNTGESVSLLIGGMTCNACANSVEKMLKMTPGVHTAVVNFAIEKATVSYDSNVVGARTLIENVENIGYEASILSDNANIVMEDFRLKEISDWRYNFFLSLLFTFPIIITMTIFGNIAPINHGLRTTIIPGLTWMSFVVFILSTPVQFIAARRFHVEAWSGLKRGVLGMPFLVSMGTNASYFYGVICSIRGIALCDSTLSDPEFFMTSSMLVTFVMLGKFMESIAKRKTSEALSKLLDLGAKSASLLIFDKNETVVEEKEVPIGLVQRGDILKVVRGASVPADGEIIKGDGRIDESMLTGESKLVKKKVGDKVMGATVNVDGLFHMKVTGIGNDTALSQIIRLVEAAQTSRAPIQAYADYIASRFVPAVLIISFITFITWYILCLAKVVPQEWIPLNDSYFVFAFNFGIATLVVACPCALGLATPTAVMVGTGVGAECGVLIKGGEPLEVAHGINTILFDKTGTLTVGQPTVTDLSVLDKDVGTEKLIYLAASAELGSEHPLGRAIIDYSKLLAQSLDQPESFEAVSGKGIKCIIGSTKVTLGNRSWMKDQKIKGLNGDNVEQAMTSLEESGKTSIYVAIDDRIAGIFGIADAPRPEAHRTISKLQRMGLSVWMVTGDNRRTANAIASNIGIPKENVMAGVLPSNKAEKVKMMQDIGKKVAMVGDGINDSPALAQADLGVAIGAGTEIAIETADMVLVKSDLSDVITAIDLSRTIFGRIRLNYIWALGYNCLLIPLAAGIFYPFGIHIPPMFAGGAMAISSVSVVTSSLLLRLYKPPVLSEVQNISKNLSKPTERTPLLSIQSVK